MTLYIPDKPDDKRKAVLAGICEKNSISRFERAMKECAALCEACNIETAAVITQNSRTADPSTAFRSGKLEELCRLVAETDAGLIVFYNTLSVKSAQRIAEITGVPVIDRVSLILDIFSQRARTKQAKLQTEMARLQYDLPRVMQSDNNAGHERGGSAYNRGAGEMRSQVIQRKYRERITDLKKELKRIEVQRTQDEARRSKTLLGRAAMVGYTNAGKSSLMNALLRLSSGSGTEVMEKDMLFATLDTSVRMISINRKAYLFYDTVGFVSDLPHTLVEAFRSTLDAARDADLLVHVIDSSDPEWEDKAAITEDTLKSIGADDIPVLRVFTKTDLVEETVRPDGICVSSLTGEGVFELSNAIVSRLYPAEKEYSCLLPYAESRLIERYKSICTIDILESSDDGYLIHVSGPEYAADAFRKYAQ